MKVLIMSLLLSGCVTRYEVIDMKFCQEDCENGVIADESDFSKKRLKEVKDFCRERLQGEECCMLAGEPIMYPMLCDKPRAMGKVVGR